MLPTQIIAYGYLSRLVIHKIHNFWFMIVLGNSQQLRRNTAAEIHKLPFELMPLVANVHVEAEH